MNVAPEAGRRAQNKADKRTRITRSSRRLFREKGFAATTMLEIAEAAGVAAGTLYNYAPAKEDLLIMVFHDEILEVVDTAYTRARGLAALPDRLLAFFGALADYFDADLPLARSIMRQFGYVETAEQRALVTDLLDATHDRLAALVAPDADGQDATARNLFAVYYYGVSGYVSGFVSRDAFDQQLRGDLQVLLDGVSSSDPAPSRRPSNGG